MCVVVATREGDPQIDTIGIFQGFSSMGDPGLPPSSLVFARVELAVYVAAFALNLILLVGYIKHRRDLLVRTIDYLFVLIVVIHLLMCVLFGWVIAYIAMIHGGFDGSPASDALCLASGTIAVELSGNAVTAHMLIAIERLMTVSGAVKDTRPTLLAILAVVEVLAATAVVLAHVTGGFEPSESGVGCFLPFRPDGAGVTRLLGTFVTASYCALASAIVLFSYTYIYITVILARRRATGTIIAISDEKGRALPGPPAHGAGGDRELKVFYRCIGVVLVFLSTYLLQFGTFAYRLVTGAPCPVWVDTLAATLSGSDALLTPVTMVLVNRKVAEAAASVVGLRLPTSASAGDGGRRVHPVGDMTVRTLANGGRV
ncbi:hypothetical protein HK101_011013 [Irineochytrium annulatum]|nr:hypothetical protein HK101_011013 [Irineochytrium annulatum]